MTYEYFNSDPRDALYNLARAYPGGLKALALRLERAESVLYKQLCPSIFTHHISLADFIRIGELCAEAGMPSAYQPLHALCFELGHVALRLPSADVDAGELFAQVLAMLREEGELARCIQDSISDTGPGGKKITRGEMATVEGNLERCIGALVTLRELVRNKHRGDAS